MNPQFPTFVFFYLHICIYVRFCLHSFDDITSCVKRLPLIRESHHCSLSLIILLILRVLKAFMFH